MTQFRKLKPSTNHLPMLHGSSVPVHGGAVPLASRQAKRSLNNLTGTQSPVYLQQTNRHQCSYIKSSPPFRQRFRVFVAVVGLQKGRYLTLMPAFPLRKHLRSTSSVAYFTWAASRNANLIVCSSIKFPSPFLDSLTALTGKDSQPCHRSSSKIYSNKVSAIAATSTSSVMAW